jgi:DNA-directed RNA polymerase specialized sigma24 family protein
MPAKSQAAATSNEAMVWPPQASNFENAGGLRVASALHCQCDDCRRAWLAERHRHDWRWFEENHAHPRAVRVLLLADWLSWGRLTPAQRHIILLMLVMIDCRNEAATVPTVEVSEDDADVSDEDREARTASAVAQLRAIGLVDEEIAVLARHRDGCSYREIARLTGVGRNRVAFVMSEALTKITTAGYRLTTTLEPVPHQEGPERPRVVYVDPAELASRVAT